MATDVLKMVAPLSVFVIVMFVLLIMFDSEEETNETVTGTQRAIEKWARENNYQIRAMQLKGTRGTSGPFIGKMFLGQHVYRVVVTPIGEEKRRVAWIRYGTGPTNSADKFTLIWEDEWRPPEPPLG